jgi:hypothetical protein
LSHSLLPCAISILFWGGRSFCGVAGRYVRADSCGSSPACHTLSTRKALDPHCGNHGCGLWGWTCWQRHVDTMDTSCMNSADHWHSLWTDSLKQQTCTSLLFVKACVIIFVSSLWTNAVYEEKQSSPATRHGGTWGERRYSSYLFLTSALDSGEWSASCPGWASASEKGPPVPIVQEAGWAPVSMDTEATGKSFCLCQESNQNRPVVQPVAIHYTDWAAWLTFLLTMKWIMLLLTAHVAYMEEASYTHYSQV